MIILLLAIIFLLFIFTFSKEDFVFLRKNVSQETLFDIAFLAGLMGLIMSRLIFILLNPSTLFLNPLAIIMIPYFPGLSFGGFIFGFFATVYLFIIYKKLPAGRIIDLFSLGILISSDFFYLYEIIISILNKNLMGGLLYGIFTIIILAFFLVFNKAFAKLNFKEGIIAFATVTILGTTTFLLELVNLHFKKFPLEFSLFLLIILLFLIGLIFANLKPRK